MYLILIFIPPLYFIVRKKWGGFIINSVPYGIACLCILSIAGIIAAPFFWIFSVGHACFAYRREMMAEHANLIASKMAEKMRQEQPKV